MAVESSTRSAKEWTHRDAASLCVLPLIVVLLAFIFRLYHLDYQSLWSDEGISILRSSKPLLQMLREMPVEHVPGYFVGLHFWFDLAGTGDFSLRYFSLLPGVLSVALVYRLGADLGSRRAGLVGAVLLATSSFQVWYAQEGRMYTWLLGSSLAATWFLWRLLNDSRHLFAFAGYVLSVTISVYLHFYGFLVPIAHIVFVAFWVWRTRQWHSAGRWALAGTTTFLLFLPWLPRALDIFSFGGWREPRDPGVIPWRYLTAYTVGDAMPAPWHTLLPALYLLLACAGVLFWWRRRQNAGILLVVSVLVPLGVVIAYALRNPDFHERYSIMMSAPLLLLVGAGIAALTQWRRYLGAFVAAALLAGLVASNGLALHRLYTDERLHKPDFRSAAARIRQHERENDVILIDGPDPEKVFLHYYDGENDVFDLRPLQDASAGEIDGTLRDATNGAARAWGLLYFHPPGPVQVWMAEHAWPTAYTTHNDIRVTLYGLPAGDMLEQSFDVQFGPAVTLADARIGRGDPENCANAGGISNPVRICAGRMLHVTTNWQVAQPPADYKFSLRLPDDAGRVWAAEDYIPQDGFSPTNTWEPGKPAFDRRGLEVPADVPPGNYELTLRLYEPATGTAVETSAGVDVPLVQVQVLPPPAPLDPEMLDIPTRVERTVTDTLTLLGYDVTPQPIRPGQPGELSLWWRVEDAPLPSHIRVELLDEDGAAWAKQTHPLGGDVSAWEVGQIVRTRYPVNVDPAALSGRHQMKLFLLDGETVTASSDVGAIAVQARDRTYDLPPIENSMDARVGEHIMLRGYDLDPSLPSPGDTLDLTLYWQTTGRVHGDYKVFVHLYDAAVELRAQVDAFPQDGNAPTNSWLADEVIEDSYTVQLPSDLPAGRYQLVAGIYDPATGQRLPARDAGGQSLPNDAVPLESFQLR